MLKDRVLLQDGHRGMDRDCPWCPVVSGLQRTETEERERERRRREGEEEGKKGRKERRDEGRNEGKGESKRKEMHLYRN